MEGPRESIIRHTSPLMSLEAGARIGPYEVVCALGQGGMGEVYRGRDSRLGRDVAIKTLPVPFARDPERNARFAREAQLLAALNHPHIAGIYGVEEDATSRSSFSSSSMVCRSPIGWPTARWRETRR